MYPVVRPISDQAQLDKLINTMKGDGHSPLFPTHEVRSSDELETIGYISLSATPVANIWMHTKKAKIRDSLFVLRMTEALARSTGRIDALVIPCMKDSPFYPYLQKAMTKSLGDFTLFYDKL